MTSTEQMILRDSGVSSSVRFCEVRGFQVILHCSVDHVGTPGIISPGDVPRESRTLVIVVSLLFFLDRFQAQRSLGKIDKGSIEKVVGRFRWLHAVLFARKLCEACFYIVE